MYRTYFTQIKHYSHCTLHIAYFHRVIICCLYIIVLYCCRQQGDTRTSRHLVKIVVFIWLYCSGAGSNGHTSRHLVINVVCLWLYCTVAISKTFWGFFNFFYEIRSVGCYFQLVKHRTHWGQAKYHSANKALVYI